MSAAVGFALASLACAGLTDVVFKKYSAVARSRGIYVLGIGVVWSAAQAAIVAAGGGLAQMDAQTVGFGLVAGLLVALSNTFLIEGLTHVDVGLGSTIYRLNTIAVVVLAVLLLDETLTATKAAGVLLGVAAVILLFEPRHAHRAARDTYVLFFALVVLASLLRACFGILAKVAALDGVDLRAMLLVNAPVWIVMGAAYAAWRREPVRVTGATLGYAAASGLLICGVANFLMLAVELAEASVVVPIANMSFVVALLISIGLRMERLTGRKLCAIALAAAAIVLLARA